MTIKKIVKSVSVVALALVMGFGLAACGKDDPKSYLEEQIKASSDQMKKIGDELIKGDTSGANSIPGLSGVINLLKGDKDALKEVGNFAVKMSDFDFNIDKVDEKDDEAVATVTFKTYNFGEAMKSGTKELEKYSEEAAKTIKSPQVLQKALVVKLFKYVAETPKEKDLEQKVELNLKKVSNKWTVSPESINKISMALTGGIN